MPLTITTTTTLEKEGKTITLTETRTLDTVLEYQQFKDSLNEACSEFIKNNGSQHEEEQENPPA